MLLSSLMRCVLNERDSGADLEFKAGLEMALILKTESPRAVFKSEMNFYKCLEFSSRVSQSSDGSRFKVANDGVWLIMMSCIHVETR